MIKPYGGTLVERMISDDELESLLGGSCQRITVSPDDEINIYNIASGAYSPLTGFMTGAEYDLVIRENKLPSGQDWTIPVLLRVTGSPQKGPAALCGTDGTPIAVLEIENVFEIDMDHHARRVFGTADREHPGVRASAQKPAICAGGRVSAGRSKTGEPRYLSTAKEIRGRLAASGKNTFTAFSTRNICHIGHEYLHSIALEVTDILGVNVITGAEVTGKFSPDAVFDTYEYLIPKRYPDGRVFINNLRLPTIYAGPKEAFLQAVMLQNFGFTHFIVGRDHAGINSYYPKYASQEIFRELGSPDISIFPFAEPRFCNICAKVTTERSCRHGGGDVRHLNGGDVRRILAKKKHDELKALLSGDMLEALEKVLLERKGKVFL